MIIFNFLCIFDPPILFQKYAVGLAEQLGIKGPKYATPLGQSLDEEALNALRDDQVAQLYELMLAATQPEVPEAETETVQV